MGTDERFGLYRTITLASALLPFRVLALVVVDGVRTFLRLLDDGVCNDLIEPLSKRLACAWVSNNEYAVVQSP